MAGICHIFGNFGVERLARGKHSARDLIERRQPVQIRRVVWLDNADNLQTQQIRFIRIHAAVFVDLVQCQQRFHHLTTGRHHFHNAV